MSLNKTMITAIIAYPILVIISSVAEIKILHFLTAFCFVTILSCYGFWAILITKKAAISKQQLVKMKYHLCFYVAMLLVISGVMLSNVVFFSQSSIPIFGEMIIVLLFLSALLSMLNYSGLLLTQKEQKLSIQGPNKAKTVFHLFFLPLYMNSLNQRIKKIG